MVGGASFATAQEFSLGSWTVDGGGGTSEGGVYSVTGTIGQHDAGKLSGGDFTVSGGLWGVIAAVQTPGAPLLSIGFTASNTVVISWPYPSTGFVLEQNGTLGGPTWQGVTTPLIQARGRWQITLSPPSGNRFYRLRGP